MSRSFTRKIIYLVLIAALILPLFYLSQPATRSAGGKPPSPGGVLAQMRKHAELSPAQLGEIDPTSVTLKLATLGFSGIAMNILWTKATDFQMKKDFVNQYAVLNEIMKLQPNYISVWSNQAWNVSYNISVQFDDYRERYRWVVRGFDFLKEGMFYNERQPRLPYDLGHNISQKIGKADEKKEFRQLLKQDDDLFARLFDASWPVAKRDNWLAGKYWYDKAIEMVANGMYMILDGIEPETRDAPKGKSYLLYRSGAPMCQMYYSEYLEKDGVFGQVARQAWSDAAEEWNLGKDSYGNADIPTFYQDENGNTIVIHLNDQEREEEAAHKLLTRLDALQPGLRDQLIARKRAGLTRAQKDALATPVEKRTAATYKLLGEADEATRTTDNEVARHITDPRKRAEGIRLADEIEKHNMMALYIRRDRDIVNFANWRLRAQVERGADLLQGRRLIYQAGVAYAEGRLVEARAAFEEGFRKWRKVLDAHTDLVADTTTGEDLVDVVKQYRELLGKLGVPFPKPFILQDVVDAHPDPNAPPPPREVKPPPRQTTPPPKMSA
jgi:hypothetical protein